MVVFTQCFYLVVRCRPLQPVRLNIPWNYKIHTHNWKCMRGCWPILVLTMTFLTRFRIWLHNIEAYTVTKNSQTEKWERKNVPNANQTNYRVQIPVNQIVNANLFLHGVTAGNDVKDWIIYFCWGVKKKAYNSINPTPPCPLRFVWYTRPLNPFHASTPFFHSRVNSMLSS